MLKLHATPAGILIERDGKFFQPVPPLSWDGIFAHADPGALVAAALAKATEIAPPLRQLAPIQSQEVWAAGVTYFRSRTARMEESKEAGGGTFYDKVYHAPRPELFYKAAAHRVAAPGGNVRIRRDSKWNVPEPEFTLALNSAGRLIGCTIGNDMSSRDIEGENPLYLPQAKVYDQSAALGPCLLLLDTAPPPETTIAIDIVRAGASVFAGTTTLGQIKRPFAELAEYLFRDHSFPHGCYLMTGTGIIPPDAFTLAGGDEIRITIGPIGTLVNTVA
jgi:2-dehydro-3-deoxy-D-arabinonate dehydratase